MSNNINAEKQVEELAKAYAQLTKEVDDAVDVLKEYQKTNQKLPSEYLNSLKKLKEVQEQYNKAIAEANGKQAEYTANRKEQERLDKAILSSKAKLAQSTSKEARELANLRAQTNQNNKENREAAKANVNLASAYARLRRELLQAEKTYKDLAASQGLSNKQTIEAQRQVNKLRGRVDAINKPIKRFGDDVGMYPRKFSGAISVIKGLVGAFGLIEGIRLSFDFAREAVEMSKAAKGVEFAFKRLGDEGVDAFDRIRKSTRGLVSDLDIKTSLVDFDNFNISLKDTDVLFEFLAVRAAQTGKSIDSLKDSLVEGLSKESKLRIDNLGIATADLNAELEKTPNFVEAVANIARREVAEAGDILDKAANSSERFSVSLENMKLQFGNLITSQDVGILGFVSDKIQEIGNAFDLLRVGLNRVKRGFRDFLRPIKETISQFPILQKILNKTSEFFSDLFKVIGGSGLRAFAIVINQVGGALSGLGSAISEAKKEVVDLVSAFLLLGTAMMNPIKTVADGTFLKALRNLKSQVGDSGENIGQAFVRGYSDAMRDIKEETEKPLNEIKDIELSSGKSNREKVVSLLDLIGLPTTEEAQAEFEKYGEDVLETLRENFNIDEDLLPKEITLPEIVLPLSAEKARFYRENFVFSDEEMSLIASQFDELGRLYNVDASKFTALFDQKENTIGDYVAAAGEAMKGLYNSFGQNYEDDLLRARDAADRALLFAGENSAAQAEIKEQLAEKERRIRIRQARDEKQQAIFSAIINTAAAVVKALPNIPLSVIIGALGAAEIALIASRPVPQFWQGGEVGQSGTIMVNDDPFGKKGRNYKEVVETPSGRIIKPQGKNVKMNVPKGTIIHPTYDAFLDSIGDDNLFNIELQKMLDFNGILPEKRNLPTINIESNSLSKEDYQKGVERIISTMNSSQGVHITVDENGMNKFITRNNQRTQILNNRLEVKKRYI